MSELAGTVEVRFTAEGISATQRDAAGNVTDEMWFTWAEVDELKTDENARFTFEVSDDE